MHMLHEHSATLIHLAQQSMFSTYFIAIFISKESQRYSLFCVIIEFTAHVISSKYEKTS